MVDVKKKEVTSVVDAAGGKAEGLEENKEDSL